MKIVGITGKAGSGKDSLADFLVAEHGFTKVALADPLKRACREFFDFTDSQLWGPSEMRNALDHRYPRAGDPPALTPRYALQKLGTEFGRDCYGDVWVEYLIRTARQVLDPVGSQPNHVKFASPFGVRYSAQRGVEFGFPGQGEVGHDYRASVPGVVVSDVRFANEVEAIRNAGGFCCRLTRPGAGLKGEAGQHLSETQQDGLAADMFLTEYVNDGDLAGLARYAGIVADLMRGRA